MKQSTRFESRALAAVRDGNVKRANTMARRARIAAAVWDKRKSA